MIKEFYINPVSLDKWMHQNKAVYTGDFVEGCLLDNFVVLTKHGIAAIYEQYVTSWTSTYRVEFQRERADESGWTQNVMDRWYKFEELSNACE